MSVGESGALDHCSPLGLCESGKDMQTDGILKIVDLGCAWTLIYHELIEEALKRC